MGKPPTNPKGSGSDGSGGSSESSSSGSAPSPTGRGSGSNKPPVNPNPQPESQPTQPSDGGGSSGGSDLGQSAPSGDKFTTIYEDPNRNVHVQLDYSSQGGGKYDTVVAGPGVGVSSGTPGQGDYFSRPGPYSGSRFTKERAGILERNEVRQSLVAAASSNVGVRQTLRDAGMITTTTPAPDDSLNPFKVPGWELPQPPERPSEVKGPVGGQGKQDDPNPIPVTPTFYDRVTRGMTPYAGKSRSEVFMTYLGNVGVGVGNIESEANALLSPVVVPAVDAVFPYKQQEAAYEAKYGLPYPKGAFRSIGLGAVETIKENPIRAVITGATVAVLAEAQLSRTAALGLGGMYATSVGSEIYQSEDPYHTLGGVMATDIIPMGVAAKAPGIFRGYKTHYGKSSRGNTAPAETFTESEISAINEFTARNAEIVKRNSFERPVGEEPVRSPGLIPKTAELSILPEPAPAIEISRPNIELTVHKEGAVEFTRGLADTLKGQGRNVKVSESGTDIVEVPTEFSVQAGPKKVIEVDYFGKFKEDLGIEKLRKDVSATEEPGIVSFHTAPKSVGDRIKASTMDILHKGKEAGIGLAVKATESLPLKVVDVRVSEGVPLYRGISFEYGRSAYPLIGSTPKGLAIGTPEFTRAEVAEIYGGMFAGKYGYPAYTPTELAIARTNIINRYDPLNKAIAEDSLLLRDMTLGTKSRYISDELVIDEPLKTHGLKPETIRNVRDWFSKQDIIVTGSVAQKTQLEGFTHRELHDIDFYIQNPQAKARELLHVIEKTEPGKVKFMDPSKPVLVTKEGGTLFDIHPPEGLAGISPDLTGDYIYKPKGADKYIHFGFGYEKPVMIGGVKATSLSEQATRKMGSSIGLRENEVMPAGKRIKDIADYLTIEPALIASQKKGVLSGLRIGKIAKETEVLGRLEQNWLKKAESFTPKQKAKFFEIIDAQRPDLQEVLYVSESLRPQPASPSFPAKAAAAGGLEQLAALSPRPRGEAPDKLKEFESLSPRNRAPKDGLKIL